MTLSRWIFAAGAAAIGMAMAPAQAAPAYQFKLLPGDGNYSAATAINNAGQIVGEEQLTGHFNTNGVMWSNGVRQVLDPESAVARGISADGRVAGDWGSSNYDLYFRYAATTVNGVTTVMPHLGPGPARDTYSEGYAINSAGHMVGRASTGPESYWSPPYVSAEWHAVLYKDGAAHDLGTLGGSDSRAVDINEAGTVVGRSTIAPGRFATEHAFIYDAAGGMRDLGTLGGASSRAVAINDEGAVLGLSNYTGGGWKDHTFLYQDGVMTDLGNFQGIDINNHGQILGIFNNRPFILDNGKRYYLDEMMDPTGFDRIWASGFNDLGQVVGSACNDLASGGSYLSCRAVLFDPLTPVPEPATWGMTLAGLGVVGMALRRRRGMA